MSDNITSTIQGHAFDSTPEHEEPESNVKARGPAGRWFPTESHRKGGYVLYQRCTMQGDEFLVEEMWRRSPDDEERPRPALAVAPRRAGRYPTISAHRNEEERPALRRRLGLFCLYYIEALDTGALNGRSSTMSGLATGLYRHPVNTWAKTDIQNTLALIQEGDNEKRPPWWTWSQDLEGRRLPALTDAGRAALAKAERTLPDLDELGASGIETKAEEAP